jgi:hypothetical protein
MLKGVMVVGDRYASGGLGMPLQSFYNAASIIRSTLFMMKNIECSARVNIVRERRMEG